MKKISLKDSYEAAITIMKDRAVSFYHAFSKLPKNRFQSIAAIYAFCRYADDVVDNSPNEDKTGSLASLASLERALRALYLKEKVHFDQAWWPSLVHSIETYSIPLDGFTMQIEGQRRDLNFKDIETIEELIEYARLVAGSVGILLAPLLADKEESSSSSDFLTACEALGIGMQITNILRDVGEDMRTRNRIYLPKTMLDKHHITRKEIEVLSSLGSDEELKLKIPPAFVRLWEELSSLADTYYAKIEEKIKLFHKSCRIPLLAAALVYHAISDAVRKEDYNCFSKRCYTDRVTRNNLILKAALYKKNRLFHPVKN